MRVASVGAELKCFDWNDQSLISIYTPESRNSINTISWAKDSGWVILVPDSGSPELISINNAKLLYTINTVQSPKCAGFQNCTKRNVAISSLNGNLLSYDIKTKSVRKKFQSPLVPFFKLEYTIKDTHLLAGTENGEVYLFNNTTGMKAGSFKVPKSSTLTNFRCNPVKNNLVGGCSEEGIVTIWDINISKSLLWFEAHNAPVNDLCFAKSNEKFLITIGGDRRLSIFDVSTKKPVIDKTLEYTPTAIDFCPDGLGIAVGLFNGNILSYDVRYIKDCTSQFNAHSSTIKQILFEKVTTSKHQNSVIILPEESVSKKSSIVVEEESFTSNICTNIDSETKTVMDSKLDMFLHTDNSIKSEADDTDTSIPCKSGTNLLFDVNTPVSYESNKALNVNKRQSLKSQMHSTPKDSLATGACTLSPIVGVDLKAASAQFEDIKKFVKDTVKEEVQALKNELKQEIKEEMYHLKTHTRQGFLDLQMFLVREFIDLSHITNRIKNQLEVEYDE